MRHHVTILKPLESKIEPLSAPRDERSEGRRIYRLDLKYTFHVTKITEFRVHVPILSDVLYESELDSQLVIVQDTHGRVWMVSDAYPQKYSKKLDEGEYTMRLHIRHDRRKMLESLADTAVHLEQKLAAPVSIDIYSTWSNAILETGKKMSWKSMLPGDAQALFIDVDVMEKYVKGMPPGSFLTGTMTLAKDEPAKKASTIKASLLVSPHPHVKKNSNTATTSSAAKCPTPKDEIEIPNGEETLGQKLSPSPEGSASSSSLNGGESSSSNVPMGKGPGSAKKKSKSEEFEESERDHKIQWLSKFVAQGPGSEGNLEKGSELYAELVAKCPSHVPVHLARLTALTTTPTGAKESAYSSATSALLQEIIAVSDSASSLLDQQKMLLFFGHKVVPKEMAKEKSQMEKDRSWLTEALSKKGLALLALQKREGEKKNEEEIEKIWTTLLKFVDCYAVSVSQFTIAYSISHGLYSKALRSLLKQIGEKSQPMVEDQLEEVLTALQWDHVLDLQRRNRLIRFPKWKHIP